MQDWLCSLSACIWNAWLTKQYNAILALHWIQMVNSQGWESQAEKLPLAHGKNSDANMLLQKGNLLTLVAVLGSLNKLLALAITLQSKAMT